MPKPDESKAQYAMDQILETRDKLTKLIALWEDGASSQLITRKLAKIEGGLIAIRHDLEKFQA